MIQHLDVGTGLRASARLLVALVVGLQTSVAMAADHGDGWLDLDVRAGLDLSEGPPYPATPVEIGVAFRDGSGASEPGGGLFLTLLSATDEATASAVAVSGTAVDNEHGGEPGDTASMDVHFVPGNPPDDTLPDEVRLVFRIASDPESDDHYLRFRPGTLAWTFGLEQSATTITGDEFNTNTTLLGEYGNLEMSFGVDPSQPLEFDSFVAVETAMPDQVDLTMVLRRTAAGTFDPDEPLVTVGVTSHEIRGLPAASAWMLAAALLAVALLAGRRATART